MARRTRDLSKFNRVTIEPRRGETYCSPGVAVYGYKTSVVGVMRGREIRCFLAGYDTVEEAKAAYPMAREAGCGHIPHADQVRHLPDDEPDLRW
jgi:hypothetical protein